MADFGAVEIMGTLSGEGVIKDDGTAYFTLEYHGGAKPMSYMILTKLEFLVSRTIQPYMTKTNIGKRLVVIGSIVDFNIIAPSKIYFVDKFLQGEDEAAKKGTEIDFSED